MASAFALQERAKNKKLFSSFIQKAAGLEPGTENFTIALQFCLQNCAQHTFLDPNPSTISNQFKDLLQRLEISAQLKKADALRVLTAKFHQQPITSSYPDVNASILSLLYHLADAPVSTPLDFEPNLFDTSGPEAATPNGDDSDSGESDWSYSWSTESDLRSECDSEEISCSEGSGADRETDTDDTESSPVDFDWKTYSLDLNEPSGASKCADQIPAAGGSGLIGAIAASRGRGLPFLLPKAALRTTEAVLVRQVLRLLQGTVQSAFVWQDHQFLLVEGVHVPHLSIGSLQRLLAPFLTSATSLRRIQAWITSVRFKTWQSFGNEQRKARGPTVEAFADALLVQVQGLLALVSEQERKAAHGGAGTQVTLLALRQTLRSVLRQSQLLEEILDAVVAAESGSAAEDAEHVLTVLYQRIAQYSLLEDGEDAAYRTTLSLFRASLRPMLTSLDAWLEEGTLQDAANELFICANSAVPIEDSAFWLLGHSLRRRSPPSRPQTPETPHPEPSRPAPTHTASHRASFTYGQSHIPTSDPLQGPLGSNASTPASPPHEPALICPPFLRDLAAAIFRTGKSLQLLNHVHQDPASELVRPSAGPFPRTAFPFSSPSKSPFRLSAPQSPGLRVSTSPTPPDARSRRASLVTQLPSVSLKASPMRSGAASSPGVSHPEPPDQCREEKEPLLRLSRGERPSLYQKFCGSLQSLVSGQDGAVAKDSLVSGTDTGGVGSGNGTRESGPVERVGEPEASSSSPWAQTFEVGDWAAALRRAAAGVSKDATQATNPDAVYAFLPTVSQKAGARNSARGHSPSPKAPGPEVPLTLPPLEDGALRAALSQDTSTSGRGTGTGFNRVPASDFAAAPNGGALVAELCQLGMSTLMQRAVGEPTWLPPPVFQRGQGAGSGDDVRWLQTATLEATPPPSVLIQECLLKHISQQVDRVGARLLSRLMGEWQLIEELAILRAVYLMGSGDVLHQFTTALFAKLERREPWDDFHELNTMLQNSVRSSGDSALSLIQDSLTIKIVDPPGHRPVLRSFGIDALDCLRFTYRVSWPLELIISESAVRQYNQVMGFLLKLKRAKHGLDRAARWKINGQGSSQGKQRLLFQQKLLHFINTLHQYVMDRVLHSAWLELRTEMGAASSLDEVIACHERYLAAIQKQCLVASDKLWTLLASRVRTMISIALDFCSLQRTLAVGGLNPDVQARCAAELQRLQKQFHESMVFLLRVLSSKLNVGHFPHLADLVIRINYNHYYMNEQGRILLPPVSA